MSRWSRLYPVLCCMVIGAALGSEALTAVRALTGFGPLWFGVLLDLAALLAAAAVWGAVRTRLVRAYLQRAVKR